LDSQIRKYLLRGEPRFRTPTLPEFFLPRNQNATLFPVLFDPLAPGGAPGERQFVVARGGTIVGGSVDLEPEKSDSYSAGFVLTPQSLKGGADAGQNSRSKTRRWSPSLAPGRTVI
jgi:outer membrane receptor protein involved in Fe transport